MTDCKKIFPLRLPSGYHGSVKEAKKLSSLYKSKVGDRENPELGNIKNSGWQRKRLDVDVINERRELLVHPGKISLDTPYWWQTTTNFYRRNEANKRIRPSPSEKYKYDVFNRERVNPFSLTSKIDTKSEYHDKRFSVTQKVGAQGMTSSGFWSNKSDVSPKVGSVQTRNFSIKRPQLKIGQEGFVDTYCVN